MRRNCQPAFYQRLVDLQVKLQTVRFFAVAKRLVGTEFGTCQMGRAVRQIERVAMPLENPAGTAKPAN